MKNLDNIGVKCTSKEQGAEIIETFKKLGVDTIGWRGNNIGRYYFSRRNRIYYLSNKSILKIISLDELKAMVPKEETEFDRMTKVTKELKKITKALKRHIKKHIKLQKEKPIFGYMDGPISTLRTIDTTFSKRYPVSDCIMQLKNDFNQKKSPDSYPGVKIVFAELDDFVRPDEKKDTDNQNEPSLSKSKEQNTKSDTSPSKEKDSFLKPLDSSITFISKSVKDPADVINANLTTRQANKIKRHIRHFIKINTENIIKENPEWTD